MLVKYNIEYKVLGGSRTLKEERRVIIPKEVREKLRVKDGDFLYYLLTDQEQICENKET